MMGSTSVLHQEHIRERAFDSVTTKMKGRSEGGPCHIYEMVLQQILQQDNVAVFTLLLKLST